MKPRCEHVMMVYLIMSVDYSSSHTDGANSLSSDFRYEFPIRLRVATVEEPPYFTVKPAAAGGEGETYEGYMVDVMKLLTTVIPFSYEWIVHKEIGSRVAGEWTGMLNSVLAGEADVAAAPFLMQRKHSRSFSFTQPFLHSTLSLLVSSTQRNMHDMQFLDQALNLSSNQISFGVVADSRMHEILRNSNSSLYRQLWNRIKDTPDGFVSGVEAGLERVRARKFALVVESVDAAYVTSQPPCDVITFDQYFSVADYSLAVARRDERNLKLLNNAIGLLRRNNAFSTLFHEWWVKENCQFLDAGDDHSGRNGPDLERIFFTSPYEAEWKVTVKPEKPEYTSDRNTQTLKPDLSSRRNLSKTDDNRSDEKNSFNFDKDEISLVNETRSTQNTTSSFSSDQAPTKDDELNKHELTMQVHNSTNGILKLTARSESIDTVKDLGLGIYQESAHYSPRDTIQSEDSAYTAEPTNSSASFKSGEVPIQRTRSRSIESMLELREENAAARDREAISNDEKYEKIENSRIDDYSNDVEADEAANNMASLRASTPRSVKFTVFYRIKSSDDKNRNKTSIVIQSSSTTQSVAENTDRVTLSNDFLTLYGRDTDYSNSGGIIDKSDIHRGSSSNVSKNHDLSVNESATSTSDSYNLSANLNTSNKKVDDSVKEAGSSLEAQINALQHVKNVDLYEDKFRWAFVTDVPRNDYDIASYDLSEDDMSRRYVVDDFKIVPEIPRKNATEITQTSNHTLEGNSRATALSREWSETSRNSCSLILKLSPAYPLSLLVLLNLLNYYSSY